jgi:hypothetical protein
VPFRWRAIDVYRASTTSPLLANQYGTGQNVLKLARTALATAIAGVRTNRLVSLLVASLLIGGGAFLAILAERTFEPARGGSFLQGSGGPEARDCHSALCQPEP